LLKVGLPTTNGVFCPQKREIKFVFFSADFLEFQVPRDADAMRLLWLKKNVLEAEETMNPTPAPRETYDSSKLGNWKDWRPFEKKPGMYIGGTDERAFASLCHRSPG